MAQPKRNRQQRHADLDRINTWRMKGWTIRRIADELGLAPATIKRDLDTIDRLWGETFPQTVDAGKRIAMARWEYFLSLYVEEFEKSRETEMMVEERQRRVPVPEQNGEMLPDGVTAILTDEFRTFTRTITTSGGVGDPHWAKRINEALIEMGKIVGVYAAESVNVNITRYFEHVAEDLGVDAAEFIQEAQEIIEQERRRQGLVT